MSGSEIAQIIVSIATLLTAGVGAYVSLRNSRQLGVVRTATDGMKTELVELTAKSSKAEGNLEGRAELKQEQKDA